MILYFAVYFYTTVHNRNSQHYVTSFIDRPFDLNVTGKTNKQTNKNPLDT